ncbi:MAG: prepilin-type N-terminal cleavage/methylation domain-containing protein, partial [Clostridiales bacterium]|nr:prepilin-type N-terminal cleavage/methylation domain-containing protein [Clostridiales bacterium]
MEMRKILSSRKGFTLVELLIVVIIMAILVAVTIPVYGAVTSNAQKKTCAANRKILSDTLSSYKMGVMTTSNRKKFLILQLLQTPPRTVWILTPQ